jgi:hypothetical protein
MFDGDLRNIKYSALLGGSAEDTGFDIHVDAEGRIVIAGNTNSVDFPIVPESFDDTYNGGGNDLFVLELSKRR